jgi:hypothetical protein
MILNFCDLITKKMFGEIYISCLMMRVAILNSSDPTKGRNYNLWFPRPTPYTLGHRITWKNM